jgi:anti-sigma regulatory factor (Ser/Thr protein kinase)
MPATVTARRPAMRHYHQPPQPPPGQPPRVSLALGAVPTAPACTRAWTRAILAEWQLSGLQDVSELIVSELASNALAACRREHIPCFWLTLTLVNDELAILVRDFCAGIPQAREAGEDDEDGRGLQLVEAMSDRSGWYPARDGLPGKVVYAVLPTSGVAS